MAQDDPLVQKPIKSSDNPFAPTVPAPPPEPEPLTQPVPTEDAGFDPAKNFGWITNLPKSTLDMAKSVVYDLPKAVLTAGVNYTQNPNQYQKDLQLLFARHNGLGSLFRDQFVNYYTNDFWHNFNEDPARFFSDAAALASFGGGTVGKLAEAGKFAEFAEGAQKVAQAAHYIDPLQAVGKVAGKVASPIMEGLGFGKYTQEANAVKAVDAAKKALLANDELRTNIFSNLDPQQNSKLLRLIRWGERGDIAEAELGNDLVSRRWKIYKDGITGGDEPLFKDLDLLDDETAKKANALKMSEYSEGHYQELGLQRPVTPQEAYKMAYIDRTHNPTFMSSFRQTNEANTLFSMMNKAQYRGGVWSRFERMLGMAEPLEDVNQIMARQIMMKWDNLHKLDLMKQLDALMAEKGERIFVPEGGVLPEWARKTHAPVQNPFYEKYYGDLGKAAPAAADALVRSMLQGGSALDGVAAARKAIDDLPDLMKFTASKGQVYWPKHMVSYLNRELAPVSPIGRLFDNVLARYKSMATVFNPKFWPGVLFGQTGLGLFYGMSPDYARIAYKYREFLPPEMRELTRAEFLHNSKGIYSKVANNLGEYANKLYEMFQNPLFVQSLANSPEARLKFGGQAFFMSKDAILNAVKYYGAAGERLAEGRAAIEALKQQVVNGSQDLQDFSRKDERIARMMARTAASEGPKGNSKKFDFFGNKVERPVEPIENIKSGKPVGGKPGPDTGIEYDELGRQIKGPKVIQDQVFGELNTLAKRYGPVPGVTLPDDMAEYVEGLRKAGWKDEDIRKFLSSREVQAELRKIKQPHAEFPQTSAGDEAKQIAADAITGAKEAEFAEHGSGGPVPIVPVDVTVDPATGARIIEDSEKRFWEVSDGQVKPLTPKQERMVRLARLHGNLEYELAGRKEDVIRKLAEIGELHKRIPGLIQDAAVADRAIEESNRFFGSYLRQSPFERKTLRRLLPFYTWNKAMTMLAFRMPYLYPKRVFIGAHLAQVWNDIMADENAYMPSRLRDYVPVAARPDGSVIAISAGYLNPMGGARVGSYADLPMPSVFNPLRSNPIINLILKMNGAIPEWSSRPIPAGDFATRLDNGEVIKWTGKGFQTVIAQPSLIRSLFDMFPQSQLINRLIHPYAQSDRGWLFSPDPIKNPDGTPRFPRELHDTLMSMILPTETYNPDDVKAREAANFARIIKQYASDLRYASPVRRQQIMDIIEAFQLEKNRKWVE